MCKTGHSLMKTAMAEMGAPLAGEMSGHIFYADGFYGHDDALYVAIRLLDDPRARASGRSPSWRDRMAPMVNTPELRFDCPDETEVRRDRAGQGAARGRRAPRSTRSTACAS